MLVDAIVVSGLFGTILVPREAQAVIIVEALVDALVVFGLFGTISHGMMHASWKHLHCCDTPQSHFGTLGGSGSYTDGWTVAIPQIQSSLQTVL